MKREIETKEIDGMCGKRELDGKVEKYRPAIKFSGSLNWNKFPPTIQHAPTRL